MASPTHTGDRRHTAAALLAGGALVIGGLLALTSPASGHPHHDHADDPPTTAQAAVAQVQAAASAQAVDHAALSEELAAYHALLAEHVDDLGFVDYDALRSHTDVLRAYTHIVAHADLAALSEQDRLALLINAYNAYTLQLILESYDGDTPPETITALADGKPWDQVKYAVAGKDYSLNQIEHELIRGHFDEPRIHWAVVCAAFSCPPLRAEAYTGPQLEAQLADQERRVLLAGDERFVKTTGDNAEVTQLFNWYGEDFGDPSAYLAERLERPGLEITGHLFYDWKLNSRANRPQ
ncbi:MAG: DUF547 domain-containing protein [Planctomycetota bacterium]